MLVESIKRAAVSIIIITDRPDKNLHRLRVKLKIPVKLAVRGHVLSRDLFGIKSQLALRR